MSLPTAVVIGVGAARGLGAAICRRFAAGGYHVIMAGRTAARIDAVVTDIVARGGSAQAVVTDTTREEHLLRPFDRAMVPAANPPPWWCSMPATTRRSIFVYSTPRSSWSFLSTVLEPVPGGPRCPSKRAVIVPVRQPISTTT